MDSWRFEQTYMAGLMVVLAVGWITTLVRDWRRRNG